MTTTENASGRAALSVAHVAGMIDLVALPVWVGTLIGAYKFSPQEAGGLATMFLAAVVVASLVVAPLFNRLSGRLVTSLGFAAASIVFMGLSMTSDYATMAAFHGLGGLAVGCSLSMTHGTIGRGANPHRLFAIVNMALGVFAILFLGGVPQIIQAVGRQSLFQVFSGVMLVAAVVSAIGFPKATVPASEARKTSSVQKHLSAGVWFGVCGVAMMTMTQSMMFSFVERIGVDRGFGHDRVVAALIAVGIVNMTPAVLAAMLQRKWPATRVMIGGPICQAILAMMITQSTDYPPYAVATSVFVFVMLFTHTFAFGLLARMDPSCRAVAATPAMLMTGSAIGPFLGGVLVQQLGYASLGFAVCAIATVGVLCFLRVTRDVASAHPDYGTSALAGSSRPTSLQAPHS